MDAATPWDTDTPHVQSRTRAQPHLQVRLTCTRPLPGAQPHADLERPLATAPTQARVHLPAGTPVPGNRQSRTQLKRGPATQPDMTSPPAQPHRTPLRKQPLTHMELTHRHSHPYRDTGKSHRQTLPSAGQAPPECSSRRP